MEVGFIGTGHILHRAAKWHLAAGTMQVIELDGFCYGVSISENDYIPHTVYIFSPLAFRNQDTKRLGVRRQYHSPFPTSAKW